MCTPSLAIDAIIEVTTSASATAVGGSASPASDTVNIILVRRRDPPLHTHAIPGGFVNIGESKTLSGYVYTCVVRGATGTVPGMSVRGSHFFSLLLLPTRGGYAFSSDS